MIRLAQVGCGLQSQRQVNTGFVEAGPTCSFVAVVDSQRDSQNYVDWSGSATATRFAAFSRTAWGAADKGIRGGRTLPRDHGDLLPEAAASGAAFALRRLPRVCSRRRPTSQGVINITPDISMEYQHRRAQEGQGGDLATSRSQACFYEVRRTLQAARESSAVSHLLAYSNNADRHTLAAWIQSGVIGPVREVHNWTDRPVLAAGHAGVSRVRAGGA